MKFEIRVPRRRVEVEVPGSRSLFGDSYEVTHEYVAAKTIRCSFDHADKNRGRNYIMVSFADFVGRDDVVSPIFTLRKDGKWRESSSGIHHNAPAELIALDDEAKHLMKSLSPSTTTTRKANFDDIKETVDRKELRAALNRIQPKQTLFQRLAGFFA